jgi:hypothetical protein
MGSQLEPMSKKTAATQRAAADSPAAFCHTAFDFYGEGGGDDDDR